MIERITGAAIRLKNIGQTVYSSYIGGLRHPFYDVPGLTTHQRLSAEQGFVTNIDHRFVDRKEARRIAINARQVDENDLLHSTELFSEDLW